MNEELDSQLSAMFDNELPPAECELLARRLSRDEQLKARWGRYAAIGATIRAEGGARLNAEIARRVRLVISKEPLLAAPSGRRPTGQFSARWWRPVTGGAVAASVAAASILWLRFQAVPDSETRVAQTAPTSVALHEGGGAPLSSVSARDAYVVPARAASRPAIFPSTQLAKYVVAHSEFSSPMIRRNLLSALMVNESGNAASSGPEPTEDADDDAKNAQ
ncbi:MAG TPA: sigma-E factor negative regulatory protein [Steroidobacteraceae bacterium]|nr:sigma-E factor negative regulatory protein [Steroidobacteraceae bacterium]